MAGRLSDKRCEEIKEIVVRTFEELNIRCIPISGFETAMKFCAVTAPYSSKSGKYFYEVEAGIAVNYSKTAV